MLRCLELLQRMLPVLDRKRGDAYGQPGWPSRVFGQVGLGVSGLTMNQEQLNLNYTPAGLDVEFGIVG